MQRVRTFAALVAAVALAGCGSNSDDDRAQGAQTYCSTLQRGGVLFEPMSQCLREYERGTNEPNAATLPPSHFFDNR